MPATTLDEYVVRLGSVVDGASWGRFNLTLKDAEKSVGSFTAVAVTQFLKVEASLVGLFTAAGAGIIGLADKTAMADQQYRLFGMRMLMTKESARAMQIALDELGATLDEVSYDAELKNRFRALNDQNLELGKSLGPSFNSNMMTIRDLKMEYKELSTAIDFVITGAVSKLIDKLGYGSGGLLNQLDGLNAWFRLNIPSFADDVSSVLVVAWQGFTGEVEQTSSIVKKLAHDFTFMVGVLANDKSLETETTNFHQFATAIKDVVGEVSNFTRALLDGIKIALIFAETVGNVIYRKKLPDFTQHIGKDGKTTFDIWNDGHGKSVDDFLESIDPQISANSLSSSKAYNKSSSSSDILNAVKKASQQTGIPEDLIYSQWALETGGFTNKTANGLNNLGGIKIPGTMTSKKYSSLDDFASDYSSQIKRNWSSASGASTPEDFAHALHNGRLGSYFDGTEGNYASGMSHYKKEYDSGDVHISQVIINVPKTLPEDQWNRFVHSSMKDVLAGRDRVVMAQTAGGVYQ